VQRARDARGVDLPVDEVGCPEDGGEEEEAPAPAAGAVEGAGGARGAEGGGRGRGERLEGAGGLGYEGAAVEAEGGR
jgi:hypothetical protein